MTVTENVALTEAANQSGIVKDAIVEVVGKEFTLPSGKRAVMRKGKGKDIVRASRALGTEASNPMALVLAVAAQKCTIEGQPVTYEDLLEFDDEDCWALIGRAQKGKELLSQQTTSPNSEPKDT